MKNKVIYLFAFLLSFPLLGQDNTIYIWDFADRNGQTSDLTINLTEEFEEALIRTDCCQILQRRNYSRLFNQRENQIVLLGFNNLSSSFKKKLNEISANAVVFGETYDDTNSGQFKVSVSIEDFSGEIINSASTYLQKYDINNPRKREEAVAELIDKLRLKPSSAKPVETKEVDEWVFELRGCKRIGKDVQCNFSVTSNYRDRIFKLDNDSSAFDEFGYQYEVSGLQVGNKNARIRIKTLLIDGVKTAGFVKFSNISSRATTFKLLTLDVWGDDLSTKRIDFRDIEIE